MNWRVAKDAEDVTPKASNTGSVYRKTDSNWRAAEDTADATVKVPNTSSVNRKTDTNWRVTKDTTYVTPNEQNTRSVNRKTDLNWRSTKDNGDADLKAQNIKSLDAETDMNWRVAKDIDDGRSEPTNTGSVDRKTGRNWRAPKETADVTSKASSTESAKRETDMNWRAAKGNEDVTPTDTSTGSVNRKTDRNWRVSEDSEQYLQTSNSTLRLGVDSKADVCWRIAEGSENITAKPPKTENIDRKTHMCRTEIVGTEENVQTGIVVSLKGKFGFIKPDNPACLSVKGKDIYFQSSKAPKEITENVHVCFVLDEQGIKDKPSAKRIWFSESVDGKTEILSERKDLIMDTVKTGTLNQTTVPVKLILKGQIVNLTQDNSDLRKGIGFIKPSEKLPQDYAQDKDVHFICADVQNAGLDLCIGDTLEFVLGTKFKQKPTAFHPKLVDCQTRSQKVIEEYLKEIQDKICSGYQNDDFHTKTICELLACKAVWRCVANAKLSVEGVNIFMQLIVGLQKESKGLEENFKQVLKEVAKTSFFNPTAGNLKHFIQTLQCDWSQDGGNMPAVLTEFALTVVKNIPHVLRLLLRVIKPLVSNKESSLEKFLYQLLLLSSEAQSKYDEFILWNEMPLVPTANEMFQELSPNDLLKVKPKGPYASAEEYVEVYFRLLREDCFDSLKKGVHSLLNGTLNPRDMFVFQCTRLCGVYLSQYERSLSLALEVKPLNAKKNWKTANNLIFGNLVCISIAGNFSDIIWGTVLNRDLLKSHDIVHIQLCTSSNHISSVEIVSRLNTVGDQIILVESPTYYRAFEPVLRRLQEMNPSEIPFQEELIHVEKSHPLVYQKPEMETLSELQQKDLPEENKRVDYTEGSDLSDLDESQAKAIQHVLSNRLAIIQGPPGTGKTYIGVKLIKLLKSMKGNIKLPILVLTYKNHALDEFMRYVDKLFPAKVARIGGRSRDPVLQKCRLNEIKRTRSMPDYQYEMLRDHKADLEKLKVQIQAELVDLHHLQHQMITILKQKLTHTQIQNILLGCVWNKTDVPSMKKTDDDGFIEVKRKEKLKYKVVRQEEAIETINTLNQSVASFLESEDRDSEMWQHINHMTEAALKQWVPPKSKFEEFVGKPDVNIFSVIDKRQFQNDSSQYEEKDDKEEEKERLASNVKESRSDSSILTEMLFLPKESHPSVQICDVEFTKFVQTVPLEYYANILNPWKLSLRDRVLYVQALVHETLQEKKNKLEQLLHNHEELVAAKKEIEDNYTVSILKDMSVVGMTITGASIYNHLLTKLRPEIVIVEEAGEVLEAQMIPVLGKWINHLVLIGDHKQLRPPVESFALAKKYHLDISMMERLINNDLDYQSLQMQNRMREEFAELLLDIYPNLQSNIDRVCKNRPPLCAQKSMFFWTHSDPETGERSFRNKGEADRAIKLATFFIQQGYEPSQITILAAYHDQVTLLRNFMRKAKENYKSIFKKHNRKSAITEESYHSSDNSSTEDESDDEEIIVQIQTVDNYQGDENDVIIVSLVRSNGERNVGFLNTLNRRCVAQSRARCGMYFIGNIDTLSSSVHWNTLINNLQERECVGPELVLQCPRHATAKVSARVAENITLGRFCPAKCNEMMSCKVHRCTQNCQPTHLHAVCYEQVEFVFHECKHIGKKMCYEDKSKKTCEEVCNQIMSCKNHVCGKPCQPSHGHRFCYAPVYIVLSKCNHVSRKMCFQNENAVVCTKDVEIVCGVCGKTGYRKCSEPISQYKCQVECKKILPCKHMCTRKCFEPCSVDSCYSCKSMRLEREEQERKQIEAERKKFNDEVLEEIRQIKISSSKFSRSELQPFGETASEYHDIEDKVKKYIQTGHNWFPVLTKIEKVENSGLRLQWLQCRSEMLDPTYEALKFHGTSAEAVDAIVEKGFKMPKSSNHMYGPGIYFATDSSKSAQEMYTKGSNMLLLCRVLLGKTYTVDSAQKDMTLERLRDKGYDSLYAVRDSRRSGGVLYDEYVVFDVHQALPQYVVHYTKADIDDTLAKMQSFETTALASQQMKKYTVVPKREIKMDDPLDIHLRIAESQFQRLLNSRKYAEAVTQIKSLDYYINPPLVAKFQAKAKEFKRKYGNTTEADFVFGFHGTKEENIPNIVKENFSLAHLAKNTGCRGAYGAGIYFSEFPSVSLCYGKSILLCKVLPGKSFDVSLGKSMLGAPLETGYDSHRVKKDEEGRGYALVIFNPDQILPCYVINL